MAAVVALKPRQYSFTSQAVANPAAPPPGDRLDSEIDRIDRAIWVLSAQLDALKAQQNSRSAPVDNDENHAAGMAAVAEDWALVSLEWAEHMPDTIPPGILASNAITGDHWSSRWWANRAAQLVTGAITPGPPTNVIAPGSGATVSLPLNVTYVNNPATLASLTLRLPFASSGAVIEIGFRSPVTSLAVTDDLGVVLPSAPTSAYGPGAALFFRYETPGWLYWK